MVPLPLPEIHAAYAAAKGAAALQDRCARGLIRLTGPDRVSFLHGQTTNEVNNLPEGGGNEAAILTPKGKMVAQVRVLRRKDDLLVDCDVGLGTRVLEHLQRGCISEEVELEDLSGRVGQLGLYGPKAAAVLEAAVGGPIAELARLDEHQHREIAIAGATVTAVGSRAAGLPGFDLLVAAGSVPKVWNALLAAGAAHGLEPMGEETFELLRVEAGLPRYGRDMGEDTIPLEANLERAISYHKGCYVGQEVVAKATFRGHVNRKLVGLTIAGDPPPPQAELQRDGRTVGKVTTALRFPDGRVRALGYVKRDLARPGETLTLANGATAVTAELPFRA